MSLLPNRFQINDEMPTLGQLVREAIQPEPCEFRAFDGVNHNAVDGLPAHPKLQAAYICEKNCRQIKEAATCNSSCWKCKQTDIGQYGEYACSACGLATLWGEDYQQIKGAAQDSPGVKNEGSDELDLATYAHLLYGYSAGTQPFPFKQPGQWLDCSEDMPDLPAGKYEVRYPDKGENKWKPEAISLRDLVMKSHYKDCQYREIQS